MLKHYITTENPTIKSLMESASVGRIVAKRALMLGWPELNLPALPNAAKALIDPSEVHKQMAGMHDKRKEIAENLFGNAETKPLEAEVVGEANRITAESSMAARVAASVAVKSARAVEKFIDRFTELIDNNDIELPEKVRIEHIIALAKAADTAAGAIHKATQTEKLTLGEPDSVAGAHVAAILIGATKEEMRLVIETGNIPPRLLGIAAKEVMPVAEAEIIEPEPPVDVTNEVEHDDNVTSTEENKAEDAQHEG